MENFYKWYYHGISDTGKNTNAFTEFFPHALDKTTQLALGKFPTKVKISMTFSNSVHHDSYISTNS
jgi:hypothetical protein